MQGPDRPAPLLHGIKHARIHRPAGVQDNSPAQFFFANPSQFLRNNCDFLIGCGDQDHSRCQDLPRHSGTSLACPHESNGSTRARFATGNDRANLPPQFTQPAAQRAPHASRPDDGEGLFHLVLA